MQKILVFQQNGSGKSKIEGINQFGDRQFSVTTYDIDAPLPPVIDDTSDYLPETIDADIVLDFLAHRDLSEDLSLLCQKLKIPVIASGKKITTGDAVCPPT
jgi:thymidylate synthase